MEKLRKRYSSLVSAFDTLNDALELYLEEGHSYRAQTAFRDSLIKRFEYTIELLWKYVKLYMEVKEGATISLGSPKSILEKAADIKLVSREEYFVLASCVSARNLTSHIYKEEVAREVVVTLRGAVPTFSELILHLKP